MSTAMAVLRSGALSAIFYSIVMMLSLSPSVAAKGALQHDFYSRSCPNVEDIIYNSMYKSFKKDKTVAPGVLRLAYHDCFVRGCDASLLLDGSNTEKTHAINKFLHGFDAIDAAKEAVEKACPGIVSCADVLQFAVRDAVILTQGHGWAVPAGRRDGKTSIAAEVPLNLLTSNNRAPNLLKSFQNKGLNAAQMVDLQGAHTIGKAPCVSFDDRLHNGSSKVDPALAANFASSLEKHCPIANLTNKVNLDLVSPGRFDTHYYTNIINNKGLLTSDQSLLDDSRTKGQVYENTDSSKFLSNFASAMITLSQVDVLTETFGEIRHQCRCVN